MGDEDEFIGYEFEATEAWKRRDYDLAIAVATKGAEAALNAGFIEGAGRLLLLQVRGLFDAGRYGEILGIVEKLLGMPLAGTATAFQAKKYKALVLQTSGRMEEAVAVARQTIAEIPSGPDNGQQSMDLHWVLIAVLAESGRLDEAWDASLDLAGIASATGDSEAAGKSFWTIGNVAFMTGRMEEAERFHGLAAEKLSKHRDVNGWALFNKASANMRLHAGLVNDETLDCIERAELAISVTGGSPRDALEVSLLRAHWELLTGEVEVGLERLGSLPLDANSSRLIAAEVSYLRALGFGKLGDRPRTAELAALAAELFREAGAETQLAKAQELLDRATEVNS